MAGLPQKPHRTCVLAPPKNHEFRMTLFWLLCVCLVLAGLTVRRELAAVVNGLRLRFFGVRVRVATPRGCPYPPRSAVLPPEHYFLPPPRLYHPRRSVRLAFALGSRPRPPALLPSRPISLSEMAPGLGRADSSGVRSSVSARSHFFFTASASRRPAFFRARPSSPVSVRRDPSWKEQPS